MKRIALFLAIAAAAIACTNEETVTPELKVTSETADLVIPTEGGELTLTFNVNVDWTAEVKEAEAKEWCSLSPASGKPGDNTLKVIALENEGTENRTVTVVLRALEATQEIVVTQLQKDALVLTGKKEFEVAYQGQNLEFAVSHNSELKATADVPWITEVKAKAVEESKLTFAVAANTGEARTGKITFEAGSLKEVVTVKQAAWALEFTVTPAETAKTFEAEGGEYEVTVAANVEYTVTVPENDWLTVADAEGVYTFTAAANTTPATREVEVKIAPKDEKHAEAAVAIKMNQKGAGAKLAVTPEEAEKWLGCAATSFDLTVDTNLEVEITYGWDAEGVEPWISYTEANGVYTFAVAENPYGNLRSAFLYITPVDETYLDLADTLSVFQAGRASVVWEKNLSDYTTVSFAAPIHLAYKDGNLLVATGNSIHVLKAETGEYVSDASSMIPEGFALASMTNDDAGNIVVASNVAYGGEGDVYALTALDATPVKVATISHKDVYSFAAGNLRAGGDVTTNGVVAMYVDVSQYLIACDIVDGECGATTFNALPASGSQTWSPQDGCALPLGTKTSDGFLATYYTLTSLVSNASGEWVNIGAEYYGGNDNSCSLAKAEYNGVKYAAVGVGSHFNYSATGAYLYDLSRNEMIYRYAVDGELNGLGAYADVVLVPMEDALYMCYAELNKGRIACIQIK